MGWKYDIVYKWCEVIHVHAREICKNNGVCVCAAVGILASDDDNRPMQSADGTHGHTSEIPITAQMEHMVILVPIR